MAIECWLVIIREKSISLFMDKKAPHSLKVSRIKIHSKKIKSPFLIKIARFDTFHPLEANWICIKRRILMRPFVSLLMAHKLCWRLGPRVGHINLHEYDIDGPIDWYCICSALCAPLGRLLVVFICNFVVGGYRIWFDWPYSFTVRYMLFIYNNHYLWCFCFVILLVIDYGSVPSAHHQADRHSSRSSPERDDDF